MKRINLRTCKTCDYWIRKCPAPLDSRVALFGECQNYEQLRRRWHGPGYPTKRADILFVDIIASGRTDVAILTGEDFGCVHWTEEDAEDDQDQSA